MKKEFGEKGTNNYITYLKSLIIEVIVTAFFITLFAFVLFFTEAGFEYAPVLGTVSIAAGSFAAAFYAAKKIGEKGFLSGIIVGAITFLIVTVISLIFDSGSVTVNTLFHFIIIMLSSIIGGIIGVNKGKNRKYI